ncbi:carbohydrate binding domain-containing protein, partial [bacterium]|nr:carbohydrate binding domain-containing protein [bacterium]
MQRLIRRVVAMAAMVGCAAACAAGEAPVGQLVNAGFEGGAGKDGVPEGWSQGGCEMPLDVARDTQVKKEGARSLRLGSGGKPTDTNFYQAVTLEPGALYRVSVWVRTKDYKPVGGAQVRATVSVRTHRNGTMIELGMPHEGTTDWVQETVDFIAPGNGQALVACEYASWGRSTGTVWYDGVRLERIAAPGKAAELAEAPHGCHARAEWALRRNPPDWVTLAGALESYYAQGGARVTGRVAQHLLSLTVAATVSPAARRALVTLYGKHAWRVPPSVLLEQDVRPFLTEAARDAKLAGTAKRGLARVEALTGETDVAGAAKMIQGAVGKDKAPRERLVRALLGDVKYFQSKKLMAQAKRVCAVLMASVPAGDPTRADVEGANLGVLIAANDTDGAWAAAHKLADPKADVPSPVRRQALLALCQISAAAGDAAKTQQWLHQADEQFAKNRRERARFHLDFARQLAAQERWADVAAACQRVTASFPQELGTCFEAQRLLVRAFTMQRDHDRVLAAAKVLYAVAPNSEKEITEAVSLVMQGLKARYRSIALANDFVAFQAAGPAGKDGKKGTEDDVQNPLAAVQWKPSAEAEALFQKTLKSLPEDFRGRRWRGHLYLYWGKPELALKEFVRRYDEAPLEQKALDEAIDDLVVALKGYCGHTLAGERFMAYQKHGPKGEDGQLGTADDLE